MCGKRARPKSTSRAGGVAEKDIKRKRRKIRGGPSGERNRKVKSSRYAEKTEAGRNTQTMTHPTSSLTGTTRSPRATWRAGAPIFFKHQARPASPKSQQGARHNTRKTRAETSVFPVLFPLFSFFPFPFPSASTPQNPQRGTGGPEILRAKSNKNEWRKLTACDARQTTPTTDDARQTAGERVDFSIFVLKRAKLRCRAATSL